MISTKRGFTLIELLVVVAMIAVLLGTLSTAAAAARERARIQKAASEVKIVSQAILAYENWDEKHELPPLSDAPVDQDSIGFILGRGGEAQSGGKIPVMLMAALDSGGQMIDPWGTPYKVTIKEQNISLKAGAASGSLQTGYFMPNWYRISEGER